MCLQLENVIQIYLIILLIEKLYFLSQLKDWLVILILPHKVNTYFSILNMARQKKEKRNLRV